MKTTIKKAFLDTIPVMTGYLVLGIGFGIIAKANGYPVLLVFAMSLCIYAGSMQYAAMGLMTGGASLLTIALTTLMVNARHLFYGISMLDKYKDTGLRKPYLIFSLTDETYSLVCRELPEVPNRKQYDLLVSVLDHIYWVVGSVAGAVLGSVLHFNSQGVDFALTALFLTVFIEQWLNAKKHMPALLGVSVSAACLLIFGAEHFLIPAMAIIAIVLCFYQEEKAHA